MSATHARVILDLYPRIFLACHTGHRRDPESRKVLSDSQASLLDHLDEVESLRLTDLARHLGITPSSASLAVSRLAARGYIARSRSPGDRREVRLRLSPAGRRVRDAQEVLNPKLVQRLVSRLGTREQVRAIEGLALLAREADVLLKERSEAGAWSHRGRGS
ncbi:MAG TPA: MarR family transcriptional regulator [Planctomycetota bacterium]|nr:MarR family transcriptional regulator [Planctomycetota bacterium]